MNATVINAAIILLTKKVSSKMGIDLSWNIKKICQEAGVSREYTYEVAGKISKILEDLVHIDPGRPEKSVKENFGEPTSMEQNLTIEVLRDRQNNPGAVIEYKTRNDYSPRFKRFILERYNSLVPKDLNQQQFSAAAEIPVDTLRKWIKLDMKDLVKQEAKIMDIKHKIIIPEDANELVIKIAEEYENWSNSMQGFIPYTANKFSLTYNDVKRVLKILLIIDPRKKKPPRYRGSRMDVAPGSVLEIDGKEVDIEFTDSDRRDKRTVTACIDQGSGSMTGFSAEYEETTNSAMKAYENSVDTLGKPPLGLINDGKICYENDEFKQKVQADTIKVTATPNRGQNKAGIEGAFSEYEREFGTIVLDDSSKDSLITSAVHEIFRAFFAGRDNAGRVEFDGKSRLRVLRDYCPSEEQIRRDRRFLQKLKSRHEKQKQLYQDELSRMLLDSIFEDWNILDKDPKEHLRRFLSYCEPEAVRRGGAVFASKMEQGILDKKYAHRYLAKLVQSSQVDIDLEIIEHELLKYAMRERQWWIANEIEEYENLKQTFPLPAERCCQIAELAAAGSVPVGSAFWSEILIKEVKNNIEVAPVVRTHIKRLFEYSINSRIALLDMIAQIEFGLVAA
ncbi:MAG: hypothetical protein L6263_07675 [Desulfobacteraceae bacterium]|nr:hypothetical protein [Desulfobacteraceae bacterium]